MLPARWMASGSPALFTVLDEVAALLNYFNHLLVGNPGDPAECDWRLWLTAFSTQASPRRRAEPAECLRDAAGTVTIEEPPQRLLQGHDRHRHRPRAERDPDDR